MKLKGKIIGKFGTIEKFCTVSGWSRRKITALIHGRQKISKSDIVTLSNILEINNKDEFLDIFFDELSTMWTK